ncbi:hypothetical protein FNV35_29385, partial [Raoultella ornithinolytica]
MNDRSTAGDVRPHRS